MDHDIAARSEGTGAQTETIGLPARPRLPAEPIPHIPDYRLVKVIGRGAFGTVWLAEETLAGVFRAIKVLHAARTRTPKPTDRPAAKHKVNARNEEQRLATDAPSISKPADPWASLPPQEQRDDSRLQREIDGVHAYQAAAKEHPHLVRILKVGLCKVGEAEQPPSVGRVSRPVNLEEGLAVGDQQSAKETPAATASDAAADSSFIPHPSSFHTAAYYVMEIADHAGGAQPHLPADYRPLTLATLLRQKGRLPCEEVVRHATAMLDGIEHLHKSGLHHRDIKMANVLFVGGVLKLADMGLTASDDADETVGTPGYLPPPDARADTVASPPRGRRESGAGALTGIMPTRASAPQRAAVSPPARRFGRPDDLYALGKVMYEMLTGLPAAAFPEWPADLDPAGDPLLPRLRKLVNELCHPNADRRLADLREVKRRTAALSVPASSSAISRRRFIAAISGAAGLGLAIGGWGVKKHFDDLDPTRQRYGVFPYDGSESQEWHRNGRNYALSRVHRPGEVCNIGSMQTVVHFYDLQTRIEDGRLEVSGAYQIYNNDNPVTSDILDDRGEIDQLWLVVGEGKDAEMLLLMHLQPGPRPGVKAAFGVRGLRGIPLDEIAKTERGDTRVRLLLTFATEPEEAKAKYLTEGAVSAGHETTIALLMWRPVVPDLAGPASTTSQPAAGP